MNIFKKQRTTDSEKSPLHFKVMLSNEMEARLQLQNTVDIILPQLIDKIIICKQNIQLIIGVSWAGNHTWDSSIVYQTLNTNGVIHSYPIHSLQAYKDLQQQLTAYNSEILALTYKNKAVALPVETSDTLSAILQGKDHNCAEACLFNWDYDFFQLTQLSVQIQDRQFIPVYSASKIENLSPAQLYNKYKTLICSSQGTAFIESIDEFKACYEAKSLRVVFDKKFTQLLAECDFSQPFISLLLEDYNIPQLWKTYRLLRGLQDEPLSRDLLVYKVLKDLKGY